MVIGGSAGRFHVAGADHEVAEALAGGALQGIAADDRSEEGDDVGVEDARLVEDVQAGTVERGAEVDVVFAGGATHEPDFSEVGAAATVGATGDAEGNLVVAEAGGFHFGFEIGNEFREVAFALGEGETASRQRDTGHRVEGEAGDVVCCIQFMFTKECFDDGPLGGLHAGDDEILIRGEAEVAFVGEGDLPEGGLEFELGSILHAAAHEEERVVARAVLAVDPAVAVAHVRERELPRRSEPVAETALHFLAEPDDPAVFDRVFEAGVFAVGAVPEVTLHEHHFFRDVDGLADGAIAEDVRDAGIGFDLVVRHAEATADGDVEAGDALAGRIGDGDEAKVVREDVHIVARRDGDHGLEFPW